MKSITLLYLLATAFITTVLPALAQESKLLPWEREISLWEAAQSAKIQKPVNLTNPMPSWNKSKRFGNTMTICNLKMQTTLWGPPDRITVSLTKNNVWDRRVNPRGYEFPTLQEIIDAAYLPENKDFEVKPQEGHRRQRPWSLGYFLPEGGFADPYRTPLRYSFPCLKPVGQIILGMDPLAGIDLPEAVQNLANGVVTLEASKGDSRAKLQYVLGMTSNLYAIRGKFSGMDTPIWLRLYRHRDTGHLAYMDEDGNYSLPGTEADSIFNYPMDPPTSGTDGRYFWIRQQMPPEKTFPEGFEYVLMGVVNTPGGVDIKTVEDKKGLGTPPPDKRIAAASGAATTATFMPTDDGSMEALVTIVTTMDGKNLFEIAKQRLSDAEAAGFDGVVKENTEWWKAFYNKREDGRVFRGLSGTDCTEDILDVYMSYADVHGGGTKTDMRKYETSCNYVLPERDAQLWHSAPCYNEIFTGKHFVRNRADHQDMWKQLLWQWLPAAKKNARDMFGMPGMYISHGYQPPIKPEKIVHSSLTLEFCLGTMAQLVKPVWDEWDYGGDIEFLRTECYPLMYEMALFYTAYAKKGKDGYYHIIPSMEPERWGWYPEFARNKDVISSLCMFRWALNKAADAAEVLGVDKELRDNWRDVAKNITPYSTWQTDDGPIFCAIEGVKPQRFRKDHFGEAIQYPTILADEINLDSPKEIRDMMIRTSHVLESAATTWWTLTLLGVPEKKWNGNSEALLNSRSGRIHLFPAVLPNTEIAFRNFRARGGYIVSAAQNAKGVYFLEVKSVRDNICHIMNPWPGKPIVINKTGEKKPVKVKVDKGNGECLVFETLAGSEYTIQLQ